MATIDPRKLETFRVVVQAGKISHAAQLLHLSQPAVTAQVQALEEECGRALLKRTSRGVTPNAWGLRLLEAAIDLRELLSMAEDALREEPALDQEVVLGASMTTAAYVAPQLLAGYRALHGPVPFRVQVSNSARVLDWVAEGRVPLGLVEGHLRAPRVHLERYLDDEIVAVAAATFSGLKAFTRTTELARAPLILREQGSGTRAAVEEALAKALGGRALRSDLQLGSNQSVKMAALAGLGIAFLSRWSLRKELASGALRVLPVRGLHISRPLAWATQARKVHGAAGRFLEWARKNPPLRP
jgi:DNA-binding transcriptional LysR family regulator